MQPFQVLRCLSEKRAASLALSKVGTTFTPGGNNSALAHETAELIQRYDRPAPPSPRRPDPLALRRHRPGSDINRVGITLWQRSINTPA